MIPTLDRSEARRSDEQLLTVARADPDSHYILLDGDRALLQTDGTDPVVFTRAQLSGWGLKPHNDVLLGFDGETGWFGLDVANLGSSDLRGADEFSGFARFGEFVPLGPLEAPVASETWALLSQARALLAWNRSTAYCPVCGDATIARQGGYQRVCLNPDCEQVHFARTDPAIIVRVLHDDRCLLARQPSFRPNVCSVIAGFVEPGESLEGAVRREVEEEVGLRIEGVCYLGSQPWPFPTSLMIAFEAQALSDEIRIDEQELEAANWFAREDVAAEMAAGTLKLPSSKSIARRMIDGWLARQDEI